MADFTAAELRQINQALEYFHDNAIHSNQQSKDDNTATRRKVVALISLQPVPAPVPDRGLYIGLQDPPALTNGYFDRRVQGHDY